MIQAYADDVLVYDSRQDDYKLLALKTTKGLNKAGTATLQMQPGHPAYNLFTSYRTVLTIYKDNVLKFRGRALYPADDFYKRRTITCEGERGFFRDGVMRPYLLQDSPAAIFEVVINAYNAQVEGFKQFKLGQVTVTDPNNYIRLESTKAEKVSATVDKLVERCGGYITFSTNADGEREVNWLAELGYRSRQEIEFGSNLTDYTRTDAETELATVLIPYGAKDEAGEYLTVESVNDGLDFIQDYDAVALRGVIAEAVYWDDVTEPLNLLAKAQQYLSTKRNIITSLQLSAVDLSVLDKNIDDFDEGDLVRVRSKPHNVDEDFLLTDKTDDWLNPAGGTVSMGKEQASLVGLDTAGDKQTANELHRVEHNIRADYQLNIAQAIESTTQTLTSLIEQTSQSIKLEVSEQYMTGDEVTSRISSSMEQLADSFNFEFTELRKIVDDGNSSARDQFEEIYKYIRFVNGDIVLGEEGNTVTLRIENDRIAFIDNGAEVAYFSNNQLVVLDGHFLQSLQVGHFKWLPRENGNLSLVKVGG